MKSGSRGAFMVRGIGSHEGRLQESCFGVRRLDGAFLSRGLTRRSWKTDAKTGRQAAPKKSAVKPAHSKAPRRRTKPPPNEIKSLLSSMEYAINHNHNQQEEIWLKPYRYRMKGTLRNGSITHESRCKNAARGLNAYCVPRFTPSSPSCATSSSPPGWDGYKLIRDSHLFP
jgi:hypothetical protein